MNLTFTNRTIASWNGWFPDAGTLQLLYDSRRGVAPEPGFYDIELTGIKSVEDIERWCDQIKSKSWGTAECVQGLRDALYSICYADIVQREMIDECRMELLVDLHEKLQSQLIEAAQSFEKVKQYIKAFERLKHSIEAGSDADHWTLWLDIRTAISHAVLVHSEDILRFRNTVNGESA